MVNRFDFRGKHGIHNSIEKLCDESNDEEIACAGGVPMSVHLASVDVGSASHEQH